MTMEVEVKARVNDLEDVRKKLRGLGAKFNDAVAQKDAYFKPSGFGKKAEGPGSWIVRIRTEGKGSTLTLKALTEISGAWVEHETHIADEMEMEKILETMGVWHAFTLNKKRTRGELDEFELCLDDVKELGKFLEISVLSPESEKTRGRIIEFMRRLGIADKSIERRGYGELMGEKLGHKFAGMR